MKILIIEDEKLLADSLKALLEKKGFDVECVYDGESGAEYAETGVYDLLILDVKWTDLRWRAAFAQSAAAHRFLCLPHVRDWRTEFAGLTPARIITLQSRLIQGSFLPA